MNIDVRDLAIAIHIIDRASKAGVFSGADLSVVGTTRDRFAQAVEAAQKQESGGGELAGKVVGEE